MYVLIGAVVIKDSVKDFLTLVCNKLKIIRKVRSENLKKSKVLVYDYCSEDTIKKSVLPGLEYTVLPTRHEKFYFSPTILRNLIKNWLKINVNKNSAIKEDHSIVRKISFAYYLGCIESVGPKVVLTLIDNSAMFYKLSEHYREAKFIQIQNGIRSNYNLALGNYDGIKFQFSEFMCFGFYEKKLFSEFGYETANFFPVGSLKAGYYKSVVSECNEIINDICLVTTFREEDIYGNGFPECKEATDRLNEYLARFIEEFKIKNVAIACSSDKDLEVDYFRKFFKKVTIVKNNRQKHLREEYSTYRSMEKSKVIVTLNSTAAFEALGWGKKVLFCDFIQLKKYDYPSPLPSLCFVNDKTYSLFHSKLKVLLQMDCKQYQKKNQKYFKYFMNNDPDNPPHEIIKRKISEYMS